MTTGVTQVLTGHQLKYEVSEILAQAKSYAILASAYFDPWPDLNTLIKRVVDRGVDVRLILREPDRSKREKAKTHSAIELVSALGVKVEQSERLHAKVYLNEDRVILTSFNLVGASQNSIEIGIASSEPAIHAECLKFLCDLAPSLKTIGQKRTPAPKGGGGKGFCIGCHDPGHPFDLEKPLCSACYKSSSRGRKLEKLPHRVCHLCGVDHPTDVEKPLCYGCWKDRK